MKTHTQLTNDLRTAHDMLAYHIAGVFQRKMAMVRAMKTRGNLGCFENQLGAHDIDHHALKSLSWLSPEDRAYVRTKAASYIREDLERARLRYPRAHGAHPLAQAA